VASDSWRARRRRLTAAGLTAAGLSAAKQTGARLTAGRGNAVRTRLTRARTNRVPDASAQRHLVVCGDDPLAHRLVDELLVRYKVPQVTVILPGKRRNHAPQIARLPNVRIVEADRLDADAFRRAQLETASALALVHQDDVGNIHAALQAQEINPELRLVIRMFNMSLGHGIRRLFTRCRVLSDASMAAPSFVAAALGELAPVHVRLPGRTLYVARRSEVAPQNVICGLADTSPPVEPDLLPRDQSRADLVLAVATGVPVIQTGTDREAERAANEPPMVVARNQEPARRRRLRFVALRQWLRHPLGPLQTLISRRLRITALVLLGLMLVAGVTFGVVRDLHWWDAAYETLLVTLGGANPDPSHKGAEKIAEAVLSVVSIALIPVITAAVVEAVVNARLALALGRLREPIANHVIVVGLGNVGTRVIRQLHELGIPVVAIDKAETARGAQLARELGIPLVVGDASREETLRLASVGTCRALVALSTDDVTNLEAALHGRNLKPDLRTVLRLFDGEFADRVQKAFNITSSRSVSYLAAPAFAVAMLEREVVSTIPVRRRVLLIAEVPIGAGSALEGRPLSAADDVGEARIIALTPRGGSRTQWPPPPGHLLRPGDELVVVATRVGLGRLLTRTTASAPVQLDPAGRA
jgi:Trk K+ transport system NAD-binding subunit